MFSWIGANFILQFLKKNSFFLVNTLTYKHWENRKKKKVEDTFLATLQLHSEQVSSPSADNTTHILTQSQRGQKLQGFMHITVLNLFILKINWFI